MFSRQSRLADQFIHLFSLQSWLSRLGVFTLVFGSVFLIWLVVTQKVREEETLKIRSEAASFQEALHDRLAHYEAILTHLQAYLQRVPADPRMGVFSHYLQTLDLARRYPGTLAVGYARYEPRPTGDFSAPIVALEPKENPLNYKVIGFDMASEPARKEAMLEALKLNRPVLTKPVALKQDENLGLPLQPGFLIYLPLFESDDNHVPIGFIYAALRAQDFFEGIWSNSAKAMTFQRLVVTADNGSGQDVTLFQAGHRESGGIYYSAEIPFLLTGWHIRFVPNWSDGIFFYYRYGPHLTGLSLLIMSALIIFSLNRIAQHFRFEELSRIRLYRSEQKVRETSEFLLRLHRFTRQILSEIEYEGVLNKMAGLLAEECPCEGVTVIARPLGALEPESIDVKSEGRALGQLDPVRLFSAEVDGLFGRVSLLSSDSAHVGVLNSILFGDEPNPPGWMILRLITRNAQIIGYIVLVGCPRNELAQEVANLLRHLTSQLSSAVENASLYKQARAASEAKTSFMANMSHEIRTPLNAIVGFSEMLSHEGLNLPQREGLLRNVRQSAAQLTRLIDDILDISKVEAGQLSVEKDWIALPSLVRDLRGLLGSRAKDRGLALDFECVNVPTAIFSDEVRLKQILLNLMGNALKFTSEGFVRLTISSKGSDLSFRIEDSGPGIAKDFRDRIFEPFSQGDASATRKYGGSGLGLALARRLATLLDGQLALVRTELNKGTEFELTLHGVQMQWGSIPVAEVPTALPTRTTKALDGRRILLVEDSIDNQEIFSFFLEKAGAQVDIADNGKAAVEKALALPYDVILMDIQIPILDGKDATRLLREHQYKGPIVALTAHALTGQRKDVLRAGCDGHIAKPVTGQNLVAQVSQYVEAAL